MDRSRKEYLIGSRMDPSVIKDKYPIKSRDVTRTHRLCGERRIRLRGNLDSARRRCPQAPRYRCKHRAVPCPNQKMKAIWNDSEDHSEGAVGLA